MGKIEAINTEAYVLMLEALPTAFFFVDVETTVQVWNHAAARLSGFTSAAVKGKTLEQSGLKPEICGQQLETSSASIVRDYLQANVASSPSGTKEQMFCILYRPSRNILEMLHHRDQGLPTESQNLGWY